MKNILFTAIVFFGTFSLDFVKRAQKILIVSGTVTTFLIWFDHFFPSDMLDLVFSCSFFFYNLLIVVFMVRHIAKSEKVNVSIIINSINGYLLMGILGAVLLTMGKHCENLSIIWIPERLILPGGLPKGFMIFYTSALLP
ncbi:MAG: hypothetical protein WBG61_12370 [Desulfobacterales bacterium]